MYSGTPSSAEGWPETKICRFAAASGIHATGGLHCECSADACADIAPALATGPGIMIGAPILSFLALVTLAAPTADIEPSPDTGVPASSSDSLRLAIPAAFEEGAKRTEGLSGHALRDALDEFALSPKFGSGLQEFVDSLAASPQARRQIDEFMRVEASRQVGIAPPGVPQHVLLRAMAAASAAAELLPPHLNVIDFVGEAQVDFSVLFGDAGRRLGDRSIPVAIRRMERRMLRGLAAGMTFAAPEVLSDPERCTELLTLYAEGMENTVALLSLALEGSDATRAARIIQDLRLEAPDRAALELRAKQLAQAEAELRAAAEELDGGPLNLPPDRGLQRPNS